MSDAAHRPALPGDGIGPEIVAAARRLLEALGEFEFDEQLVGGASIDAHGTALTDEVLEACRAADAVLLGAVGGPKWDTTDPDAPRPEQGLLGLRKGLGLYANLRPVRPSPALRRRQPAARRADRGHRPARRPRAHRRHLLRRVAAARATAPTTTAPTRSPRSSGSPASPSSARRRAARRPQVTSVDKANVLETSRLWRETVERVAGELRRRRARPHAGRQRGDAARLRAGALRRDRHREPVRRHPQRRVGDAHRLAGDAALGEPRRRAARACSSRSTARPPTSPARAIANPLATFLSVAMMLRHGLEPARRRGARRGRGRRARSSAACAPPTSPGRPRPPSRTSRARSRSAPRR